MNGDMDTDPEAVEDLRDKVLELRRRHGEHAADYVEARIEACETAGESADAQQWRQVLNALKEDAGRG
jgi:hypothetical protein